MKQHPIILIKENNLSVLKEVRQEMELFQDNHLRYKQLIKSNCLLMLTLDIRYQRGVKYVFDPPL